jgi:hypothetical protein
MDSKDLLIIGGIGLLAYFFITNQNQNQTTNPLDSGAYQLEQPYYYTQPSYTSNYPPSTQPQSAPVIVMPPLPSDDEPLTQTLTTSSGPKKIQSTPQYDIYTNFDYSKPENLKLALNYVDQNKTLIFTDKPSLQAGDKVIIHDTNLRISTTGYVSSGGQIISDYQPKKQTTSTATQYYTPANPNIMPSTTKSSTTQYYTPAPQTQPKKETQPSNNVNNIINTITTLTNPVLRMLSIVKK